MLWWTRTGCLSRLGLTAGEAHDNRLALSSRPFSIAEFVAHDPRLQFRSLKHVSGSAINPQQLAEYFRSFSAEMG